MKFFAALLALSLAALPVPAQTGAPVPAFSALDSIMHDALNRYGVKGGALAVFKDGHLLFARGYGLADAEASQPVEPDSLFRWCSVTKTVTAAAVMHLVEDGKLDLDTPVFSLLDQYAPYNGTWGDPRLRSVTVRQLLHHTGGWDRTASPVGDPLVAEGSVRAAQATGSAFPPSFETVIRYTLAQRLDFSPGSRFAYSNFGFELLRPIVEKITGQSFESYARQTVLDPFGLPRVRKGSAHLAGRLPGEVKYYDYSGAPLVDSYVSPAREKQPAPYGILNPDLGAASGAWVGSVVDMAKFVSMLDGKRSPALVRTGTFSAMLDEQPRETWVDAAGWYGFGLFIQRQREGVNWNHGGYNPGSQSGFYRFANGLGYAFLFNGATRDAAYPSAYVGQAVWDALAAVRDWPQHDLFPTFYPPLIAPAGVVNTASMQPGALAPGSLATIRGADLGGLDSNLFLWLRDASGAERPLPIFSSGPARLDTLLPEESVQGDATLLVRRQGWPDAAASLPIAAVSPGLFTLNEAGLLAASLVRGKPAQSAMPWMAAPTWEPVFQLDEAGRIVARPIEFGAEDEELSLIVYCTGVRGRTAPSAITVQIGDIKLAISDAGPQMQYPGLDQIRVILPGTLAGAGMIPVKVEVDGALSNTASLMFR